MCHYPLGAWNEIGKGGINLFGHCHGRYQRNIGRQMDVGVDSIISPICIQSVYNIMYSVPISLVDGHTKDTNYG